MSGQNDRLREMKTPRTKNDDHLAGDGVPGTEGPGSNVQPWLNVQPRLTVQPRSPCSWNSVPGRVRRCLGRQDDFDEMKNILGQDDLDETKNILPGSEEESRFVHTHRNTILSSNERTNERTKEGRKEGRNE